ncbi:hypothetical protein Q8F55_008649 [Vanrija albida]|uniref:Uncharacterized protein n=1 Tax=Vanrija albida TaxID=181172 RepID=A0ABR3PRF7_9TREE
MTLDSRESSSGPLGSLSLYLDAYPYPAFIARRAKASTSSSPQLDIVYTNNKWREVNGSAPGRRVDAGLAQWVVGGDGVFVLSLGDTLHLARTPLGDDIVVTSLAVPPSTFSQFSNGSTVSFLESSGASTASGTVPRISDDPEPGKSPLQWEVAVDDELDDTKEAAAALAKLDIEPGAGVQANPEDAGGELNPKQGHASRPDDQPAEPDNAYRPEDRRQSEDDAGDTSRHLRRTPKRHRPQDNFTQHEYNVQMHEASAEYEQLVLDIDWSKTPMGPLENWSHAIRTMMSIAFASATQDSIWFGPIDDIHLI